MAFWLFKSEPDTWSFADQVARGDAGEEWGGVRNYQARNFMRQMAVGDRGFFYHSRTGLEIVGLVEVISPSHPDSTTDDPRWDCVDIRALRPLARPVTLQQIKADPALADMALIKAPRLSVQPVTEAQFRHICALGRTAPD